MTSRHIFSYTTNFSHTLSCNFTLYLPLYLTQIQLFLMTHNITKTILPLQNRLQFAALFIQQRQIEIERERNMYLTYTHLSEHALTLFQSLAVQKELVCLCLSLSPFHSLCVFNFAHTFSLSLSFTYTNFMRIVPISKALSQRKSKIE